MDCDLTKSCSFYIDHSSSVTLSFRIFLNINSVTIAKKCLNHQKEVLF